MIRIPNIPYTQRYSDTHSISGVGVDIYRDNELIPFNGNDDPIFLKFQNYGKEYLISYKSGNKEWLLNFNEIRDVSDIMFLISQNLIHPECYTLSQFRYQLFGTVNYWDKSLQGNTPRSIQLRKKYILSLLSRIRIDLNIKGKDFMYVVGEEFGIDCRPHHHFLIGFNSGEDFERVKGTNGVRNLDYIFTEVADKLHNVYQFPMVKDIQVDVIKNSLGMMGYVCKKEKHYPFKQFYISKSLLQFSDDKSDVSIR